MGLTPGQSGNIYLPEVPRDVNNPAVLYDYLQKMRRQIISLVQGLAGNDQVVVNAINLGTSGTFTISSGGSIIVTSGIVVTVTS